MVDVAMDLICLVLYDVSLALTNMDRVACGLGESWMLLSPGCNICTQNATWQLGDEHAAAPIQVASMGVS